MAKTAKYECVRNKGNFGAPLQVPKCLGPLLESTGPPTTNVFFLYLCVIQKAIWNHVTTF